MNAFRDQTENKIHLNKQRENHFQRSQCIFFGDIWGDFYVKYTQERNFFLWLVKFVRAAGKFHNIREQACFDLFCNQQVGSFIVISLSCTFERFGYFKKKMMIKFHGLAIDFVMNFRLDIYFALDFAAFPFPWICLTFNWYRSISAPQRLIVIEIWKLYS